MVTVRYHTAGLTYDGYHTARLTYDEELRGHPDRAEAVDGDADVNSGIVGGHPRDAQHVLMQAEAVPGVQNLRAVLLPLEHGRRGGGDWTAEPHIVPETNHQVRRDLLFQHRRTWQTDRRGRRVILGPRGT